MKLDVYSHYLAVTGITTERDLRSLTEFCRPLVEMGLEKRGRRFVPVPLRTYASATRNRQRFHFHRNQLDDLVHHLTRCCGYDKSELTITHHTVDRASLPVVEFPIKEMFPPRPYQVGIIDYVLDAGEKYPAMDPIIKMVTLQTGRGKTFVAQYCMKELKLRTVLHFKGGYTERWAQDLEKTFDFKPGELLIVRGVAGMVKLQKQALAGTLIAKAIIISNGTMRDYIKDHELTNGKSLVYPIPVTEFYQRCGIGFRVMDEVHQEFHLNFKIDLYTHVYRSLSLSATMEASDKFKNKVYDIAYPVQKRNDGGGYDAYIAVTAILYHMEPEVKLRYMGAQGYSHTTFEESIMKNKALLKSYLRMIDRAIYQRYVTIREPGQKALVFFARVDMCTLFVERLKKMYPDLAIARYVGSEGDSYEELLEADIGVTTIGSGGTAIDIRNLRCSFMSTVIDSRQSNEQVLGRTRRLADWPEITPEFVYFTCLDIEQHMKYHGRKKDFFRGKVVSHGELISKHTLSLDG